jgi:hypothetical protein
MTLITKEAVDEHGVDCHSIFIDNNGKLTWIGFIYSAAAAEYINTIYFLTPTHYENITMNTHLRLNNISMVLAINYNSSQTPVTKVCINDKQAKTRMQ